jgi:eukaryotic-like serine/threonine-protein kinase
MMLKTTKLFGEIKSVKFSRGSKMKSFALAFALLMLASAFLVLSSSTTPVKAQTTSVPSNMLQYEWTSPAASPTRSFFGSGPGPNAPNFQWKVKIPAVVGDMVAFNGLVFVQSIVNFAPGASVGTVNIYALDGATGNVVWIAKGLTGGLRGAAITKIDNTYMVAGNRGIKIADGSIVWAGPAGFNYAVSTVNGAGYIPDLKMFVTETYGWNLPDPSKPPTLAWNLTDQQDTAAGFCLAGDGKVFIGTGDYMVKAYDIKTGNLLWKTPTTSAFLYGASYVNGKVIQGGLDNNMRAWDANTGKLLWTYNPQTFYGQWASSSGYAYGMIYEHNQDTYLYAINATTGQLVWRQKGPGIGYSNTLSISDGKVYIQMGEKEYRDFATGEFASSEYDCFDAYTGKLLWTLPMENGAPFNSQCAAYGNLYVIPTVSTQVPGVWTYVFGGVGTLGEVWCISSQVTDWSMFMADPSHSGEGAGPTNLALKWKFETGAPVVSTATCVNGVAYFGSMDNKIYAVNANTGAKIWSFTTGYHVLSSVAVFGNKVITGADDGYIYGIDKDTGTQIWKTFAGGVTNNLLGIGYTQIRSSPAVLNGRVYVGSLDGNLYCINGDNGNVIWKFMGVSPCVIFASPTISDNAIYFSSTRGGYRIGWGPAVTNGDFYKLDLNGNVIWHKEIPYVLDKTFANGNFLFASATVAPDLGLVFLRNGYRLNYAFNVTTGDNIWTYDGKYNPGTPFQLGGAPQVDAFLYKYGLLYANDYYGVTCRNASSGQEVWFTYLSRELNNQGITYAYGRIYVATEAGVLYVLDALNGGKYSYVEFGNQQMHSSPVPYNGNLYIGAPDWNLYCFGDARLMAASAPKPQVLASDASISSLAVVPIVAAPNVTESVSSSSTVYIAIAAAVIAVAASTAAVVSLRKRR